MELSENKTCITNVCKKNIKFLGIELKLFKKKGNWKCRTRPIPEKLNKKVNIIKKNINHIKQASDKENAINELNKINSQIRGIINYYELCSEVNKYLHKESRKLDFAGLKAIRKWTKGRIEANKCNNLLNVHKDRNWKIPYISWKANENSEEMKIGLTNLSMCKHEPKRPKNQEETPYSVKGRQLYLKRTGKKGLLARADDLLSEKHSLGIVISKSNIYNYEYYLNRAYAFNRDKGKCRICKCELNRKNIEIHHKDSTLPIDKINKVKNLVSLCRECHIKTHKNC